MPYQPYKTVPRDYNPKSGRITGVSIYPLTLQTYPQNLPTPPTPPFNPASLTAPLITWFGKQDSDITYSSGNPIDWVNQGTGGGSATLYNCAPATKNGLAAVDFATAGASYGEYFSNFTDQPRAIFVAAKVTTDLPNATNRFLAFTQQGALSTTGFFGFYVGAPTPAVNSWYLLCIAQGQTIPILSNPQSTYDPLNNDFVYSAVNSLNVANNNISIDTVSQSLALNDPANQYYTGSVITYINEATAVQSFVMYEMLVYDGEVSPSEQLQVINYLKNKWNI